VANWYYHLSLYFYLVPVKLRFKIFKITNAQNHIKESHSVLYFYFLQGSLSGQIKRDGVLSEHLSKWYTKQMLEGVCFLHSHDIIHRDIKGEFHIFGNEYHHNYLLNKWNNLDTLFSVLSYELFPNIKSRTLVWPHVRILKPSNQIRLCHLNTVMQNTFTVFYSVMQQTKKDIFCGILFKIILMV